jgi:hypothetical protein
LANGDLIELGTFYLNGAKQPRPTKPWRTDSTPPGAPSAGNIPVFSAGQSIEIRDTDPNDAYKIQWREVNDGSKKLLISDRVLLVNVSWDDLNAQGLIFGKTITIDGQQYKLRVLTGGSNYRSGTDSYSGGSPSNNEWDRIITNEAGFSGLPVPSATDLDGSQNSTDFNSSHNQFWNWFYIYSWTQETYTGDSAGRAIRGHLSARGWNYNSSDSRGAGIGWRPVLEVLNSAPVVSGADSNLGNKSSSFTVDYTVNDSDTGDTLTVTEKVDGMTLRTINNAVRGQTYTLDLSSIWTSLSLGSHTITITVTDGKGGTATRTYTFTKTDDRIKFTLKNPIETSIAAKKIVVSGIVTVPSGATLSVKACNNGFDTSPTWEDITQKFLNREAHTFSNTSKTAVKWGINIQFEILKGTATDQIIVDGFGFSFE